MRDWGRLLRIALLPSAAADIAAGIVVGAGAWPSGAGPFLLVLASLAVYHGAMALNDWADRGFDADERPDRPLPAGKISPRAALTVAVALLLLSPGLALGAALPLGTDVTTLGCVAALVVAGQLAIAYDLGPRGPRRGPLLLAACRALNLGAGVLYGSAAMPGNGAPEVGAVAALVYGAYVFVVSVLGRLEDGEDDEDPNVIAPRSLRRLGSLLLVVGALALLAASAVDGRAPEPLELVPLAVAGAGAFGLFRLASREGEWSRGDVMGAMGAALRRLLVFSASVATLGATIPGLVVAVAILGGYPVSYALRKQFPPS